MVKHSNKRYEEELEIPDSLIYEIIDGEAVPYRGFHLVLTGKLKNEDVMGSSALQAFIISIISQFLANVLDPSKYLILSSEVGLHIDTHNNLAADIAIFKTSDIVPNKLTDTYVDVPPLYVIEVDTKADPINFDSVTNYFPIKTQKLLDFGVKKVVWVMTESKKITIATPNNSWKTSGWEEIVQLGEEIKFSIEEVLSEKGLGKDTTKDNEEDDKQPE